MKRCACGGDLKPLEQVGYVVHYWCATCGVTRYEPMRPAPEYEAALDVPEAYEVA